MIYSWEAFDSTGALRQGIRSASSREDVLSALTKQRMKALRVSESDIRKGSLASITSWADYLLDSFKVRKSVLTFWRVCARHSARAGDMRRAIESFIPRCRSLIVADALGQMLSDMENGVSIGDALAKHSVFPARDVELIRASESHGTIRDGFKRVEGLASKASRNKQRDFISMIDIYIIYASTAVLAAYFIYAFMPQLIRGLEQFHAGAKDLPGIVRITVGFLAALGSPLGLVFVATLIVLGIFGVRRVLTVPSIGLWVERRMLQIPSYGEYALEQHRLLALDQMVVMRSSGISDLRIAQAIGPTMSSPSFRAWFADLGKTSDSTPLRQRMADSEIWGEDIRSLLGSVTNDDLDAVLPAIIADLREEEEAVVTAFRALRATFHLVISSSIVLLLAVVIQLAGLAAGYVVMTHTH